MLNKSLTCSSSFHLFFGKFVLFVSITTHSLFSSFIYEITFFFLSGGAGTRIILISLIHLWILAQYVAILKTVPSTRIWRMFYGMYNISGITVASIIKKVIIYWSSWSGWEGTSQSYGWKLVCIWKHRRLMVRLHGSFLLYLYDVFPMQKLANIVVVWSTYWIFLFSI